MLRRCALARRYTPSLATTTPFSSNLRARSKSSNTNKKPESLFDSASTYFANLRWRVATSLTESLSKDEQKELLGRLSIDNPKQKQRKTEEEMEQETKQSIAEAVAAARAEEQTKNQSALDQQETKLKLEAEEAVKNRVATELKTLQRQMAFEKWQQNLAQEKREKQEQEEAAMAQEQEEQQPPAAAEPFYQEPTAISDHPVLGTAIADLGYKRVHIVSTTALKSLPVWKKQRTYRHKRALTMVHDKMKTLHLGMPGIIALYEDTNGALSVIDGQHRVAMMALLEEKKEASEDDAQFFDLDSILVEVYPEPITSSSSTPAQDLFLEINKAEPVKLVDLPGITLKKADRNTINEGAARLEEAFPNMFSTSQRPRVPHLNIDNLRDALFAAEVVQRHELKSPKALEVWMLEQNQRMKDEYTAEGSQKATKAPKRALEKAIKNDFFLGLDPSWMYH